MMRSKYWSLPAASVVVLSLAALSLAVHAAEPIRVTGELVEVACLTSKGEGGRGDAHASCAMAGAKAGGQLGIFTDEAVYLIEGDYAAGNNAKLLDFVAKRVNARGEARERDGQTFVNVTSMMVATD